jgi:hypothetical protein
MRSEPERNPIMPKEIDMLLEANRQGYLVVDKESNNLVEEWDLVEAQAAGLYQEEGILSHEPSVAVTSPFPGCLQLGGAMDNDFRVLGQTRHFVIFAKGV